MKLLILISLLLLQQIYAKDVRAELSNLVNQMFEDKAHNDKFSSMASDNKILSQMMAKDIVLLVANIKKKYYYKELVKSAQKFNTNLQKIAAEPSNDEVKKDLKEVKETWREFLKNIKSIFVNGKINKSAYEYILNNNEKLLRLSHKLTQSIKSQNYLNTNTNKVKIHTLKFADRERMLTQKMFKEKFLIFIHKDEARNRVRLRGSLILFENALNGLIDGNKKRGIVGITNKKILAQLKKMKKVWMDIRPLYKKYTLTGKDMIKLIKTEPTLYKYANRVVKMIENSTELY